MFFLAFLAVPARPSAGIGVVEVQKLMFFFLRFWRCPRDPLRGSAWSRCKNSSFFCVFDMPARPSAEIGVVEVQPARPSAEIGVFEVQKLEVFALFFCGARATLAFAVAPCEFFLVSANPLRRSCVSKRSRCGAVLFCCSRNGLSKLSCGLRACCRNPAVAGSIPPWSAAAPASKSQLLRVRGACSCSSGWKIATFKYRRSVRSVPAGKSQLLSTNVVRGAHSRSSGWKIATFKCKNSMRSTFPQLQVLSNLRRVTCAEQLAQGRALAQSTCAEQLAQSTCTEHMRKALARSNWRRALAQSNLQSTLRRADSCRANLHRASCAEPLAKSSLRTANFHRAKLRRAILHRAKLRERALQKLWPSCKLCY